MCGRFSLTASPEELVVEFSLEAPPAGLAPRYNIAPSQPVLVVGRSRTTGRPTPSLLRWGLERPRAGLLINARAESLTSRPAFRESFRSRRCLVPATGFYEWRKSGGVRQAFHFTRADGRPLAFAALWEPAAKSAGTASGACVILTTEPNGVTRPVHDRMPVILERAAHGRWLDPEAGEAALRALLAPAPDAALRATAVGPAVNDARHDEPDCMAPVPLV